MGTLNLPDTEEDIKALLADDKAGKYSNLDSSILWQDGRLIFEMSNRRGRVDGPHYAMSITQTLTSITLARTIQLGLLNMDDLDKPVISFMPQIDRSRINPLSSPLRSGPKAASRPSRQKKIPNSSFSDHTHPAITYTVF
ncbi:hypothetical protein N9118_12930 [Akkermansiaceae bacterium]|nr:hypothetical protein [Akkermansiaceae bacterium]